MKNSQNIPEEPRFYGAGWFGEDLSSSDLDEKVAAS
jgi:hypothetical protein